MYDIVGDIHGHAGALMELLEQLSYDDAAATTRIPIASRSLSATSLTGGRSAAHGVGRCFGQEQGTVNA